jgi:hypothetical protein
MPSGATPIRLSPLETASRISASRSGMAERQNRQHDQEGRPEAEQRQRQPEGNLPRVPLGSPAASDRIAGRRGSPDAPPTGAMPGLTSNSASAVTATAMSADGSRS